MAEVGKKNVAFWLYLFNEEDAFNGRHKYFSKSINKMRFSICYGGIRFQVLESTKPAP